MHMFASKTLTVRKNIVLCAKFLKNQNEKF